jgi:hypothetical protein
MIMKSYFSLPWEINLPYIWGQYYSHQILILQIIKTLISNTLIIIP